jgi:8-oxo-dGTP diphosphatase
VDRFADRHALTTCELFTFNCEYSKIVGPVSTIGADPGPVYIESMDIRIAAYGVIIRGSDILLAHWNDRGRSGWTLPGGGIDPGEDPADAAVLDTLLGVHSYVVPAEQRLTPGVAAPLHALRIIYTAHVTGGELTDEVDGSTDRAAWHPLDSLGTLDTVGLVGIALDMLSSPSAARHDARPI